MVDFDRSLWIDSFGKDKFPPWHCSICNKGILKADFDTLKYYQTAESKDFCEHVDCGAEFYKYIGRLDLLCSHCNEPYILTLKGGVDEEYYDGPTGLEKDYEDYFYPIYCYPPPLVIKIPKDLPDLISRLLLSSFSIFFNDFNSAANSIRSCLDKLCSINSIKGGDLNERLNSLFKKCDIDCVEFIQGLKTICNKGSHAEEIRVNKEKVQLNLDVILDAYEGLSLLFYELYFSPAAKNNLKNLGKKYD
ncbi:TPA: DUF4145 domain-containing protein [Legionella pneumophila]|nr:DUF4145 domain-containing protein [Legionella pneumophila]HEH5959001.1 DUF4145 domain-containing protein [Legionella pneumophila]